MNVSLQTCLALSLTLCAFAEADVDPDCLTIERAFANNDIVTLASANPASPRWLAQKQFRLAAAYIPADEKKSAYKAIRAGLKTVAAGLKEDPENPSLLLMGTMLDGQYLLLSPWRFFFNGQRGLSRLRRAEKLDPTNPRIALVRGTAKVVLPKVFGGNASEAADIFEGALEGSRMGKSLNDYALCEQGEWAQVDLLNWLGRALAKQNDSEGARTAYTLALKRSPDNHWVKLAMTGQGYEWESK